MPIKIGKKAAAKKRRIDTYVIKFGYMHGDADAYTEKTLYLKKDKERQFEIVARSFKKAVVDYRNSSCGSSEVDQARQDFTKTLLGYPETRKLIITDQKEFDKQVGDGVEEEDLLYDYGADYCYELGWGNDCTNEGGTCSPDSVEYYYLDDNGDRRSVSFTGQLG